VLYVSEIFHSIQGEGPNAGTPSVFLRTAGCNLRCTWCDTPYALERRQGDPMEVDEVVEKIRSFDCQHLVLTGGEPMIQQEALKPVLNQLTDFFIEVETNGGFSSEIDEYIDQYNCSPKLKGSGNKPYELKLLPNEKTWYKFVIDNEDDLEETLTYIEQYQLPTERVQFMPQGQTKEELDQKTLWLADQCKINNFRFTNRLHVHLWGNTIGT